MMRRRRRPTVELTALLDLLFVMIFLSLLQTKTPAPVEAKPVEPETKAPVAEPAKPTPKIVPVSAIFNFYPTKSNPSLPSGSYHMNGSFDEGTGQLQLGGSGWIKRPENYDMVPLKGNIDKATNTFRGRIEFQGCLEFVLRKETADQSFRGSWSGTYNCTQGETGLTLTIN
ncbi:MAG: hypothetical protein LW878_13475 [Proteobacteria bacterium]|jgi:hypothetical protein|nr:hypothetical protein [Pseudomonadota bacterium]